MQQLRIAELMPGMTTGEDLYSFSGQLLIPKGIQITPAIIAMLQTHGLHSIKIGPPEQAKSSEPSYNERLQNSEEFKRFHREYLDNISRFQTSINDVVTKNAPLNVDYLIDETLSLLYQDGHSIRALDMLMNVRDYDDCTYTHCVNVALICSVFSGWLHLMPEDTRHAMACGLFHDIGKIKIPPQILDKTGILTPSEFEIVKSHPLEGYILLNQCGVSQAIKNAALMHHEKCDGSGYPYGLKGSQIDYFAKMVCIADTYDAMTSKRPYRSEYCPFNVIDTLEEEGFDKYDTQFLLTFLENVVNSYINQRVRLSNGLEGEIVFINKLYLSRPTIKCHGAFLDLAEHKDIFIDKIL